MGDKYQGQQTGFNMGKKAIDQGVVDALTETATRTPGSIKRVILKTWPPQPISDENLQGLVRALGQFPNLERLDLSGNGIGSRIGMLSYAGISKNLKVLNLANNQIQTENDAKGLGDFLKFKNNLEVLNLNRNAITDSGLSEILTRLLRDKKLKLQELKLLNNQLTDRGVKLLSMITKVMPDLRLIDLQGNVQITGEHIEKLFRDNLTLELSFTDIPDETKEKLKQEAEKYSNLKITFEY